LLRWLWSCLKRRSSCAIMGEICIRTAR